MGIFEKRVTCPNCGTPDVRKTWFALYCSNPACRYFQAGQTSMNQPSAPVSASSSSNQMLIQYKNFRGEMKTFQGDRSTLRPTKAHISICVAPTGKRITLALSSIQNRRELSL